MYRPLFSTEIKKHDRDTNITLFPTGTRMVISFCVNPSYELSGEVEEYILTKRDIRRMCYVVSLCASRSRIFMAFFIALERSWAKNFYFSKS
jgi:hypothetical protein